MKNNLQDLLKPYGIPLNDEIRAALTFAEERILSEPYPALYMELQDRLFFDYSVARCVIAAAKLQFIFRPYIEDETLSDEAVYVLKALDSSVRHSLHLSPGKDKRYAIGSAYNPIPLPDEAAVETFLGSIEWVSGKTLKYNKKEMARRNEIAYVVKSTKKYHTYSQITLYFRFDAKGKNPIYLPPGLWYKEDYNHDEENEGV